MRWGECGAMQCDAVGECGAVSVQCVVVSIRCGECEEWRVFLQ